MEDENIETTASNSTTPLLGLDNVIPCFLSVWKIIYRKVYFYLVINTECCTFGYNN